MNLSFKTLEALNSIITGDTRLSPYRSGPKLIDFFNAFGECDTYGQGFPSRHVFVREKLAKLNGAPVIGDVIIAAFDFWDVEEFEPETQAAQFNKVFTRDGFRLLKETDPGWMDRGQYIEGPPHFVIRPIVSGTVAPNALSNLSHDALKEQIAKASEKIAAGDPAGAITNAYTLLEALLKELLRRTDTTFKPDEGDIRALYTLLKGPLNLDPKEEALELHLKAILDGFQKLIGGLYVIANKASDRHDRRHQPAARHAKLVVNAAFALGEFLCDTYEFQRARHPEWRA